VTDFIADNEDESSSKDMPVLSGVLVLVFWPWRMSVLQVTSHTNQPTEVVSSIHVATKYYCSFTSIIE